jgi:DNA repair protein RadA/Sms
VARHPTQLWRAARRRISLARVARAQTVFVCRLCGGESLKWQGQCLHCSEWNTLERVDGARGPTRDSAPAAVAATLMAAPPLARLPLGMEELDRVLGGGLVPGSVTLLGGEPGIGKSTLLLQVAAELAAGAPVVYASGEESAAQIALRAQRLGLAAGQLALVNDNSLEAVVALAREQRAALLVVDSIQALQREATEATAGSVAQLRECTAALVRFAKSSGTAAMIVGHVTKDGALAGPKLLEHLVDTVLYFESDAGSRFRMLRAAKNRFGAVNELGFFAMSGTGLKEVKNPSAIFLARGARAAPGSVVMVARDGGRPLLIEVQALVDRSKFGMPRRVAQGIDANRLGMLLAVLSRHAEVSLAEHDVFVNLVGGIQIAETATDVPAVLALVSTLRGRALPASLAAFGELGLTGEVRPVPYGEERLREAHKQGYDSVICPKDNAPRVVPPGLTVRAVSSIGEVLAAAF